MATRGHDERIREPAATLTPLAPSRGVAVPDCRYCQIIHQHQEAYPLRPARHALDSSHPRCDRHWRYECAVCGNAHHFDGTAFCPEEERFFCVDCAPENSAQQTHFWDWSYHYRLRCPWHDGTHDALDYLEFQGTHPWQRRAEWEATRQGMTTSEALPSEWDLDVGPAEAVTDEDLARGWDGVAEWWLPRCNPRGDLNREWVIDPVLLDFVGELKDRRVLDAGCGTGYLSRRLAQEGAIVVGVDFSRGLLAFARREEMASPLGVTYHEGDLAEVPFLEDGSFDVAVSNMVLQDVRRYREAVAEIFRVLRPGGRFVFSLTHPAFDRPPARWVHEPPDSARVEDRQLLLSDYFERNAIYWAPSGKPPAIGFHRPLRDYFEALHDAGFVVHRLEEPLPGREALQKHFRQMVDFKQAPNFILIDARRPAP